MMTMKEPLAAKILWCSFLAVLVGARAQDAATTRPVSIDIGPKLGRNDTQTRDWHDWQIEDGTDASYRSGPVTVTLRGLGNTASLQGFWRKAGLVHGATLAIDGVRVEGGGRLEIVLSGLRSGPHSLATFHNSIWNQTVSRLRIQVVGQSSETMVTPSCNVRHNADTATSYLTFQAPAGRDIVIRIEPDGSGAIDAAFLNGLEIDGVDPARKARKPQPENGDESCVETGNGEPRDRRRDDDVDVCGLEAGRGEGPAHSLRPQVDSAGDEVVVGLGKAFEHRVLVQRQHPGIR